MYKPSPYEKKQLQGDHGSVFYQGCSDCDITNDVNRWRLNGGMGDDDMDEDEATPFLLRNGVFLTSALLRFAFESSFSCDAFLIV